MYDAQQEITKILSLLHNRESKRNQIREQQIRMIEVKKLKIKDPECEKAIKKLYVELAKLSSRVKVAIGTLRDIEKTMNRPFMFNGMRYDEDNMFYQMKRLRLKILRLMPHLSDAPELKLFYTK